MSLLGVKVGRWESQTVSSSIPAAISAPTLTVSKHVPEASRSTDRRRYRRPQARLAAHVADLGPIRNVRVTKHWPVLT
jgi:hypothetical protein